MIDLRNLNVWLAVGALGSGVIAMVAIALGLPAVLGPDQALGSAGQVLLLLLTFIAMLLVAVMTGRMARENEVTYGLIGSAGAVAVIVFAMPMGIVTILLILIALAGGLNGGMIVGRSNRMNRR